VVCFHNIGAELDGRQWQRHVLESADVAGLALFNRPYAWLGVSADERSKVLIYVTEDGGETARVPLTGNRVWLRAACDFLTEEARFSYSTDGQTFFPIGARFTMVFQLMTFQGIRYSLFSFNRGGAGGGYADFDAIDIHEPNPRGLTRPVPYGRRIELVTHGPVPRALAVSNDVLRVADGAGTAFDVIDRRLGRVALRGPNGFLSVTPDGRLSIRSGPPGEAETFQCIETFTGELILLSLSSHRYLQVDVASGTVAPSSPGPHPNERDGVRWTWRVARR
jgi:xylan 1,4-beta-xylosidase